MSISTWMHDLSDLAVWSSFLSEMGASTGEFGPTAVTSKDQILEASCASATLYSSATLAGLIVVTGIPLAWPLAAFPFC